MSLYSDIQKLNIPDLILLFQLTPFNGGSRIYFTNNPSGVVYNRTPYISINCDIDQIKINSQGEFGNSIMNISDQSRIVSTLIGDSGNNLENSRLEVYITRKTYLDDGDTPDITAYKLIQVFQISQIQELLYGKSVKIALSNFGWMNSYVGRTLSNRCSVKYRGQYCRYAGGYFDINDNPTNDPEKDDCSGSLEACNKRHGGGLLPWKGFLVNRG